MKKERKKLSGGAFSAVSHFKTKKARNLRLHIFFVYGTHEFQICYQKNYFLKK